MIFLQGMEVSQVVVSHILESCEVYVQPQASVVRWLEKQLQAMQAEISSQPSTTFLDTSKKYITYCPDLGYQHASSSVSVSSEESPHEEMGTQLARVEIKNRSARLVCVKPYTEIFYVDYGWTATVETALLKKFPPACKDLLNVPYQV